MSGRVQYWNFQISAAAPLAGRAAKPDPDGAGGSCYGRVGVPRDVENHEQPELLVRNMVEPVSSQSGGDVRRFTFARSKSPSVHVG
jgi:hypothetical protein